MILRSSRRWPALRIGVLIAPLAAPALWALAAGIAAGAGLPIEGTAAPPVPVHIAGIHMAGPDQVLLFLADESEERGLPMTIGRDQGMAIYLGKEHQPTPRPMTHDLLARILSTLGARLERVTVTELRGETYYAEILLSDGAGQHRIDARPSDAVALAVRLDAPIFAAAGLLRPLPGDGRQGPASRADRRLGLSVQELDADLAGALGANGVGGVLVADVRPGGPAALAGVRRGDILQALGGRPTRDLREYERAARDAAARPRLTVWRDGRALTLNP